MRKILLLAILTTVLSACSGGGSDGGGGGGGGAPQVACTVANSGIDFATEVKGNTPYCQVTKCETNYKPNSFESACIPDNSGGGGGGSDVLLSYPSNSFSFIVNQPITSIIANADNCDNGCTFSLSGNTILPSGLQLDTNSGRIYGLPTVIQQKTITVKATSQLDSGNYDTYSITIKILPPPPSGLSVNNLAIGGLYQMGLTISPIDISYSSVDGSVTAMSISPSLPSGLSLVQTNASPARWGITGTPSAVSSKQTYTITATGPNTSQTATVSFQLGVAIPPSNFAFDITNVPNCVVDVDSIPLCTFTANTTFDLVDPVTIPSTVTGDNITYTLLSGGEGQIPSNELPSGGYFQTANGTIFVTATGFQETTDACSAGGTGTCLYTARASNNLGSVTTQIKIRVVAAHDATSFAYTNSPFLFRALTAIDSQYPTWEGGHLPDCHGQSGCYTISPSLPSGLSLSQISGRISGAPDHISIQGPTTYTITAHDGGGNITNTISIEIKERLPVLEYTQGGVYILHEGQVSTGITIVHNSTGEQGGALCGANAIPVDSFSISPALPAGLTLNTGAYDCGAAEPSVTGGAINGDPTVISGNQVYTVTGCNTGGCSSVNIQLEVAPDIIKVVSGERHACAIVREGVNTAAKVMCWGANDLNQLGYASSESCTSATLGTIDCQRKGRYVQLSGSALQNVVDIAAGKNHTCILNTANKVYCWGDNSSGQLGAGSAAASSQTPLVMIRESDNATFSQVSKLSAGGNKTCIGGEITTSAYGDVLSGQVYCSSSSSGKMAKVSDPSEGISGDHLLLALNLAVGDSHNCALYVNPFNDTANGEIRYSDTVAGIKCWGTNVLGQLGDNQSSGTSSANPVMVLGISNAERILDMTAGANHTCYLKSPATSGNPNQVFCWGSNEFGQLGSGTSGVGQYKTTPNQVTMASNYAIDGLWFPTSLVATANATYFHQEQPDSSNMSLTHYLNFISGKYALSGTPYSGTSTVTPVAIKDSTGAAMNASWPVSGGAADNFACMQGIIGSIYCWGKNDVGQLGNILTSDSVTPVRFNFITN